jgi:uncharacterized repeat protein (TIGR01451 family)
LAEQQNTAIRKIESDLADLAPGQSQRLSVTFRVARAGRLCHTVEVTGDNGVRASGQGCVNAAGATSMELRPPAQQRPSISLSKSILDQSNVPVKDDAALPSRNAGDTVRFTLELANTGSRELTNLTLVDRYDPSLMPVNASDGYRLDGDNLVWTIDSLPPGRPLRLEVECRCLSAVARACNRAMLTAEEGVQAEDDACLEIRAAPGGLAITVHDFSDPVALGKGTTYEIRVSNQGQTAHRDLSVVVTVPVGMLPDRIGTSGPGMPTIEGQTVRFDPVAELPAGETATYRVRVRTRQAGKYSLRAEVTSRDQPQSVAAEETTEVVQ